MQLLQTCLLATKEVRRHITECVAPPYRQSIVEAGKLPTQIRVGLTEQLFELFDVGLAGSQAEQITPRRRRQPMTTSGCSQFLAEARDINLQRVRRGGWRVICPECVDEPGDRDGSVGSDDECACQSSLPVSTERDSSPIVTDDLNWSEEPELHPPFCSA